MSEPEFSDRQQLPDSSRPTEQPRPAQDPYRTPDQYGPPNPKRKEYLATSMVRQYPTPAPDPATQMLNELTQLLKDYNHVIAKAKRFFGKYLPNQENHFKILANQVPTQATGSYGHRAEKTRPQQRKEIYSQPNEYDDYQTQHVQDKTEDFDPSMLAQSRIRETPKEKKWGFGRKAKNQDPNKPKTPLTPYFLFFSETRDILRQKYPQKSLSQIGALGGSVWRQLSENQRQEYRNRYEKARLEYMQNMKNYNGSDGVLTGSRPDYDSSHAEDF